MDIRTHFGGDTESATALARKIWDSCIVKLESVDTERAENVRISTMSFLRDFVGDVDCNFS